MSNVASHEGRDCTRRFFGSLLAVQLQLLPCCSTSVRGRVRGRTNSFYRHLLLFGFVALQEDLLSTLDLVPADKIEFLLIIAPVKESYDLACMAFKAAKNFNVPLKVCIIWPHGSSLKIPNCSSTELEPWRNYIDVVEVKSQASGSWWEICHLSSNGVLLVRPDEHIAWSAESNNIEDSARELERVFSLIMGKSPS